MLRTRLMLMAQGVVRDAETNAISVYNIFEDISVGGFPFFIQSFFVLTFFTKDEGDPNEFECLVEIRNNDNLLASFPARLNFQNTLRNRLISQVRGIAIPAPGSLTARIMNGDVEIRSCSLNLRFIQPPEIRQ